MTYTRYYTAWKDDPDITTPVVAAFLQALEDFLVTVTPGGIPAPSSPSTNDALTYNGTTWTNSKIVNANVDVAAAIAYGKLALTNSIANGDISSSAAIAYSKLALAASIVNGDISPSAAIAYSKLALANSVVNSDIAAAAAIAYSKLALTNSIVNADINSAAAIAYSKLNLTGSIVNADISASAAIAPSKLSGYPSDATKFLSGAGTWIGAGSTTYRKTTSKQVINTVTETDLLNGEITIAANAMGASSVLRMTAWGDWIQNSGAATAMPRLKVKLGSGPTTVIDTGTGIAASVVNFNQRYGWRVAFEMMNLGATNSQLENFFLSIGLTSNTASGSTLATTGEGVFGYFASGAGLAASGGAELFNTSALDMTASQALALTVILPSASTSLDMTLKGALVEII